MSASMPSSTPVFETLQDDVHWQLAAHQNVPNDEITAIATMLGFYGVAQSKATALVPQLYEVLPTIRLSYVGAGTVQASAGVVWGKNAGSTIRTPRQNPSTTNITGADLDAGGPALAADTAYYVYADADATATTVAFSISTNATTPGDSTVFRLIGGFNTEGAGNINESSVWSIAGKKLIHFNFVATNSVVQYSGTVPADDTIPQDGEGSDIALALPWQAKDANSILIHIAFVHMLEDSNTGNNLPLFVHDVDDGSADALAVSNAQAPFAGSVNLFTEGPFPSMLVHVEAGRAALRRDYRLRAGMNVGTFTVNGVNNASVRFGNKVYSVYAILEIG